MFDWVLITPLLYEIQKNNKESRTTTMKLFLLTWNISCIDWSSTFTVGFEHVLHSLQHLHTHKNTLKIHIKIYIKTGMNIRITHTYCITNKIRHRNTHKNTPGNTHKNTNKITHWNLQLSLNFQGKVARPAVIFNLHPKRLKLSNVWNDHIQPKFWCVTRKQIKKNGIRIYTYYQLKEKKQPSKLWSTESQLYISSGWIWLTTNSNH